MPGRFRKGEAWPQRLIRDFPNHRTARGWCRGRGLRRLRDGRWFWRLAELSDRPVINGRTERDDRHDGPQQAGERLRPHTISPYFNRIDSMELTVSKIRSVRRPFAVDESRHNVLLRKLDGVIGGGEIGSRLVIRELQAEVIQERDPEIL